MTTREEAIERAYKAMRAHAMPTLHYVDAPTEEDEDFAFMEARCPCGWKSRSDDTTNESIRGLSSRAVHHEAESTVDALRESGLLNDQRYEQVAYREREPSWDPYRKETMYHEADDVCGPAFPTLYEPVFRQVDVPGETP